MKSLICSVALVLSAFVLQAQFPIQQNLGGATTLVQVPPNGGFRANLINRSYADTTSANLGYSDFYPGSQIFTTDCQCLWFRNAAADGWVQLLPSGGSSGQHAWLVGGNTTFFGGATTPEILGTTLGVAKGINLTTNGVTRVALASTGLALLSAASDTTLNKPMTYNVSTKSWNYGYWYGSGGGGSSGWALLGNSGTTAGTNFIGTTDGVDFVTKTNGVERSRWNTNGALSLGSGTNYGYTGDVIQSNTNTGSTTWVDGFKTQNENYLEYNIPFATTSFTDSTLVSQLDGATTSFYFNKGLWLNGTYTGDITNSRLVAWDYGFLANQTFSQKLVFKVGDSSSSLTIGIGVDRGQLLSTVDQRNYLTVTLGDSTLSSMSNVGGNTSSVTQSSGILINKGDIVELQINQIADSVEFFYRNLTNNNSYRLTRTIDFTLSPVYYSVLGYPTIYFAKGNVKLISYSVYKTDFDYVVIGNSIPCGYRADYISGLTRQLQTRTSGVINNMCRPATISSDYTTQIKDNFNFENKTVYINGLMGNDPFAGLSAATSQANYAAIVARLRANGNRIIHNDISYRTTLLGAGGWAEIQALNAWMNTTYGGIDTIINIAIPTQANFGTWYSDGAHLNTVGNNAWTAIVLAKVPDLFYLQNPLTATTVDSSYYKPTVKDTAGREFKISWNNFLTGAGTLTSVSFTGGLISVGNPTTTPAFTITGTSGGIPYFSSTSTWASSGLLAANSLLIGGGAGAAPSSTTTGAGILTWLGTPSSANLRGALTDENGTGVALFDAATSPTFTTSIITPVVTTASTQLLLKQTGDAFGESGLQLVNRAGSAGGMFYNNGLDLVDMAFLANSANQFNFRYEHRAAQLSDPANTSGEFQFMSSTGTVVNQSFGVASSYMNRTGIGVLVPTAYLHLAAGTATVSTAPLKFTSGTLNSTAVAAQVEYNGTHYLTKASGLRYATEGTIADFYTDVNNGTTVETDIYSYTTPASTLANDGEKIFFSYTLNLSDITATATIKCYFAGTSIANTGALTVSATGAVIVNGWIVRTSSTTARASVNISSPTASTAVYTSQTDLTGLTLSGTNIVKVTAQAGGAGGGSNDITGKSGTVSWRGLAAN